MAVQAKPGFKAQRIAGPKAYRAHIILARQHRPQPRCIAGAKRYLETVLTGIAGARNDAIDTGQPHVAHAHEAHGRQCRLVLG